MTVTTFLASDWYQSLMQFIPDGKLFSLRSVFDGIPRIVQQLPTTLMLTLGGALFGLLLALIFAIVKINRVRILYPLQAFFVSFLKGTPILVQLMLTYYQPTMGHWSQYQCDSSSTFCDCGLCF